VFQYFFLISTAGLSGDDGNSLNAKLKNPT
jgi:hypothetical protein